MLLVSRTAAAFIPQGRIQGEGGGLEGAFPGVYPVLGLPGGPVRFYSSPVARPFFLWALSCGADGAGVAVWYEERGLCTSLIYICSGP